MAFTHTIGTTYKNDAGTIASSNYTVTGNTENDLSVSVPASATNQEYDLPITVADIQSMVIYSDQAVILKTNSTVVPSNTVTCVAKTMIQWDTNHHEAKPFTSDVTKIFVTNPVAAVAKLEIRILENV